MRTGFTPELDELLRQAATHPQYRDLHSKRKWELIAKMLPPLTPAQLQGRWNIIRSQKTREKQSLAISGSASRLQPATESMPTRNSVAPGSPGGSGRSRDRSSHSTPKRAGDMRVPMRQGSSEVTEELSTEMPEKTIMIHVHDQLRKVDKDFTCDKDLLLGTMKYFQECLGNKSNFDEIDISVHCDVTIFEWLMSYMHDDSDEAKLDKEIVIPVLVSASFLQMEELVNECVEFTCRNLSEILRLPIELDCLSDPIVTKISNFFKPRELEDIRDRKDKLVDKLYGKKLDLIVEKEGGQLAKCVFCNKLFAQTHQQNLICPKAKVFIDFHGSVIAEHVADRSFELKDFISQLVARRTTRREIFWKLWGVLNLMTCTRCQQVFPAAELNHCRYHAQDAKFEPGENVGVYPCCGAPAMRFNTVARSGGCVARSHIVKEDGSEPQVLAETERLSSVVCTPFDPADYPVESAGKEGSAAKSETDDDDDTADRDDIAATDSQTDTTDIDDSPATSDIDTDVSTDDADTYFIPKSAAANRSGNSERPIRFKRGRRAKRRGGRAEAARHANPKFRRQMRIDFKRSDDVDRLGNMMKVLEANRRDQPAELETELGRMYGTDAVDSVFRRAPTKRPTVSRPRAKNEN